MGQKAAEISSSILWRRKGRTAACREFWTFQDSWDLDRGDYKAKSTLIRGQFNDKSL